MLERFATCGQIIMRRRGGGSLITTSPERAAKEGGFYTVGQRVAVPAQDLAEAIAGLGANPGLRDKIVRIEGSDAVLQESAGIAGNAD